MSLAVAAIHIVYREEWYTLPGLFIFIAVIFLTLGPLARFGIEDAVLSLSAQVLFSLLTLFFYLYLRGLWPPESAGEE